VVIGETAVIGERVRVYQAVTLGAKRFPTDAEGNLQKGLPRHPVVEDDVVITRAPPSSAASRWARALSSAAMCGSRMTCRRAAALPRPNRAKALCQQHRCVMSAASGVACALAHSFGRGVRQLREAQGWSQERLAENSTLNRSTSAKSNAAS
jgi:hypothetical protein